MNPDSTYLTNSPSDGCYNDPEGRLDDAYLVNCLNPSKCYLFVGRAANDYYRHLYVYLSEFRVWDSYSTRIHFTRNYKRFFSLVM